MTPHKLSLTEQLAHSTVRIEVSLSNGDIATGTGFFVRIRENADGIVPIIVTNKHVIEDGVQGRVFLTAKDGDGPGSYYVPLQLDNFRSRWLPHPDGGIDLAVLPIAPWLTQASQRGLHLFFKTIGMNDIATATDLEALAPAEEILMIGYPNGIWDEINNLPIFRRGIAATHPGKLYNGKPEFLIDAACFPGSSGSPVFLYNSGGYKDKFGNVHLGTTRLKLLGILYEGPQHTAVGEIKIVSMQKTPVALTTIPNHLGAVIRATKLFDFEDVLPKV